MLKKRLIPVVLLKNGRVVQSKGFKRHQVLGNPTSIVWRLSNWFADELIYLDISREPVYSLKRDDLNYNNFTDIIDIINAVSCKCFMPLTVGGRIRTLEDAYERLKAGADKVSINTQAYDQPDFIKVCAKEFGSQCIVTSIDCKRNEKNSLEVFVNCGKTPTGLTPVEWAQELEFQGAGEILINSIDNDGLGQGYDIELINQVVNAVNIPVIALGGVGHWQDFADVLDVTNPSALAAANIFQYTENSFYQATKFLYEKGYNVREPLIKTIINDEGIK